MSRDVTDEQLLEALEDGGHGWTTAEAIQRTFREHVYDQDAPSVTLVGRRLSRLAREGRIVKARYGNGGASLYRRVS